MTPLAEDIRDSIHDIVKNARLRNSSNKFTFTDTKIEGQIQLLLSTILDGLKMEERKNYIYTVVDGKVIKVEAKDPIISITSYNEAVQELNSNICTIQAKLRDGGHNE
jgi:hypothetical protein